MEILFSFDFPLIAQTSADAIAECTRSIVSADSFSLSCGSEMSSWVAQSWEADWQEKIGVASPEFMAMLNISRYIAGPMIGLWAVEAIKGIYRNGLADALGPFAVIIILCYGLYGNDGVFVRQSAMAARALINYNNSLILEIANAGQNYENKLYEISTFVLDEGAIVEARSQCNGIVDNTELLACLQGAEVRAKAILERYAAAEGTSLWRARLNDYISKTLSNPGINEVNLAFGLVVNPILKTAVQGIMASLNAVIQNLVELAWLLSAIISPIPFALAFYPQTRGALTTWVGSFLSLGLFKINLNIASSTVVGMMYDRGPADPIADIILLGVGAPILAGGMTAGGAFAIFNGLSMASAGVAIGMLRMWGRKSSK